MESLAELLVENGVYDGVAGGIEVSEPCEQLEHPPWIRQFQVLQQGPTQVQHKERQPHGDERAYEPMVHRGCCF